MLQRETMAAMGLPHSLVRQQLRLALKEGGFDLNATGGCPLPTPHARNLNFSQSINFLTASYLSSAARCHEALEASPACLVCLLPRDAVAGHA